MVGHGGLPSLVEPGRAGLILELFQRAVLESLCRLVRLGLFWLVLACLVGEGQNRVQRSILDQTESIRSNSIERFRQD